MHWDNDVNAYLVLCGNGVPEVDRPRGCSHCGADTMPHRHGKFMRVLFSLTEEIVIPIFRFLCTQCRKTMSVIPSFVERHHQVAVEIKEELILRREEGESIAEIASKSNVYPGGPYSEKTLWRWTVRWNERLKIHEGQVWSYLLQRCPMPSLPRERTSLWQALFVSWRRFKQMDEPSVGLLQHLYRLARSIALAGRFPHPTEDVHGTESVKT